MATTTPTYGTQGSLTITLASLGDGSMRESTARDNQATDDFVDVLVGGKITVGTTPTAGSYINIYVYGGLDDGTTYSGEATGSDAAYSGTIQQCRLADQIYVPASTSNVGYEFGPFSVADLFGGIMPDRWGVIVENQTGAALNSTGGNHDIQYQGQKVDTA